MQTQELTEVPAIAHMRLLSTQLDRLYRDMKSERRAIGQWEENQSVSILGVLELFSDDIQGYVEQIDSLHSTSSQETALSHLHKLNVFDLDYFTTWYFANLDAYPQVKQYIDQLDHLRLLLVEYQIIKSAGSR
jgi:hypothetical protein